ncbi:alpha/beta hydrolase [Algoriphagus halophytocola]|uniref:Alpha/beta hydrolase n=1 Tax=Algoriphagus halophytocola TaxID=2991499 RepID=A0ABY6MGA5_9BACT|nr:MULTISPECIES: alpha/beta hydrolase [unclassified Algoriphagus]UZD21219.1 alpha/beta hydrolase [Algoriphagus sp. TR-M5]WBL42430.1 alpha/beta hydrolase [Algoriphagus sp. TR-M9]
MKKSLHFQYQAHYALSHEPTFEEKEVWLVLHGYGQLAEFFLRKFQPHDSSERLFIAPEGTNYNYLNGFSGRVGANWMTRHEREVAIANNHVLLDSLMEKYLSGFASLPKVKVLGFSQGAATATRWASQWSGSIVQLILWAGGFAEDMKLDLAREKFGKTKILMVMGDQDEFVTDQAILAQQKMLFKLGKTAEELSYSGGHQIDSELLSKIIDSNA